MDNPDVELVIVRNEDGKVAGFKYKVYNAGEQGKRALEGLEIIREAVAGVFASEGPEDHSTTVDVSVGLG